MTDEKKCRLLSDVPVLEGARGDDLDFASYAEVLADAAINTEDTITIGVFGEWGTGKTSLMRLIKKQVEEDKSVAAVWFNAWQYEKEKHLIVALMATIQKMLEKKWSSKLKKGAEEMGKALRAVASGISGKVKIGGRFLSAEVGVSPKDTLDRADKEDAKEQEPDRSLYFNAFEELAKCADKDSTPRIVVFVDDLDRCFPDKAVELLEGIKLVLNQPGFSFVLGVNDLIIEAFIKTKYTKDYNIDEGYFEDYLDKIVQVRVPVPVREPGEMNKFIAGLLKKGDVFPADVSKDTIPLIAEAGYRNPRKIVRLLNRVIVSSRIIKERDPLALLLNIAMDEPRYRGLREVVDISIVFEGESEPRTIGQYLADQLGAHSGAHGELAAALRDEKPKSRQSELTRAIDTLGKYEYLCNLLKSGAGMRWLKQKEFRDMLEKAAGSTVEEERAGDEKKDKTPSGLEDPIRELLNNMVKIPTGTFDMGGKENEEEQPVHKVRLAAFEIGAMPVTQAQYQAIMDENPSRFKDPNNPVEKVSWKDAMEFCKKLSERTGQEYALPTETQWEYACRAGSHTKYCFGNSVNELDDFAWSDRNSGGWTQPVGKKKPNDWGLYDMHGNVWEWCLDHWHDNYKGAPNDGSAWESERGSNRVNRGGGCASDAEHCSASRREGDIPSSQFVDLGFRVVRTVQ